MEINDLNYHNIFELNLTIKNDKTYGISGPSGSGKSSFCDVIAHESKKRLVRLLPKNEYQFLFPELAKTVLGALEIEELPLIHFIKNHTVNLNSRTTVGTLSGVFRSIRKKFASECGESSEFYSFNVPINWCAHCKGKGSFLNNICLECEGNRFTPNIHNYQINTSIGKIDIVDVNKLPIEVLHKYHGDFGLDLREKNTLENIVALGVGYLSLDRVIGTLSGGELTRLYLARYMSTSSSLNVVVDELSLGVDSETLKTTLSSMNILGNKNQLWFVDHSPIVINSTQEKIYFGPESGFNGGKVVNALPKYLPSKTDRNIKPAENWIELKNLNCRNIDLPSLNLPLNRLTIVTGESGCGKSTLLRDCVVPYFRNSNLKGNLVVIGQGKYQSVTSKSTIATYLGVNDIFNGIRGGKKMFCDYCAGSGKEEDVLECSWCKGTGFNSEYYETIISGDVTVFDILTKPIDQILQSLPINHASTEKLKFLAELGAGYLTLDRPIRTLSTGEFQRIHLTSEVGSKELTESTIFIFDEPSRGLSQNLLNKFLEIIRNYINRNGITVWMIEHNEFLLHNADYVLDFGRRVSHKINKLNVLQYEEWANNGIKTKKEHNSEVLYSKIEKKRGLHFLNEDQERETYFEYSKQIFKGGLLKELSSTARWIYSNITDQPFQPLIAIDFEEESLYSEPTFIYEMADLVGRIINNTEDKKSDFSLFDYHDKSLHCSFCRGVGKVSIFDFEIVIDNPEKCFGKGLFKQDIMEELKRFNFSKIKFLFTEIHKAHKIDLSQPLNQMKPEEQKVFWYGFGRRVFYDKKKGRTYKWPGFVHLIKKYLRGTTSSTKQCIDSNLHMISCPSCEGDILFHKRKLSIKGVDIREHLRISIGELCHVFPEIKILNQLLEILPTDILVCTDISSLSKEVQVKLKLFEIVNSSFTDYKFVFNNILPFVSINDPYLNEIMKYNELVICDNPNIKETKIQIVNKLEKSTLKNISYVWETFGYTKIQTEINKAKKEYPCHLCKGKGKFEVEDPLSVAGIVAITCSNCSGDGISRQILHKLINGVTLNTWLYGCVSDLNIDSDMSENIKKIKLKAKVKELNKTELLELAKCIKNNEHIRPR